MNRLLAVMVTVAAITGVSALSYADNDEEWATAGKVLAIAEGVRVITGGNVDVVGNVTGINGNRGWFGWGNSNSNRYKTKHQYAKHYECRSEKRWVPNYTWKRKYIPEHEEYDERYGQIIVEAHYIQYRVEDGGYWQS